MKIVVCIKQVPDTSEIKIDPVTNNLVRTGIPSILNPADKTAVAVALDLKERLGAEVTVITMGPPQASAELKKCLKWGADRAVLLSDRKFGGADTLATANTLAEFIENIEYDLVLFGAEAADGSTGQVGPGVGERLGIPTITYVDSVEIKGDMVKIMRNTGSYRDLYETKLPCAACIIKQEVTLQECNDTEGTIEIVDGEKFDSNLIGSIGSPTKVVSISYGNRVQEYLWVDHSWSLEQRMEYIYNGGLELKEVHLIRTDKKEAASIIFSEIQQKGDNK